MISPVPGLARPRPYEPYFALKVSSSRMTIFVTSHGAAAVTFAPVGVLCRYMSACPTRCLTSSEGASIGSAETIAAPSPCSGRGGCVVVVGAAVVVGASVVVVAGASVAVGCSGIDVVGVSFVGGDEGVGSV